MVLLYNILSLTAVVLGMPFILANVLSSKKRRETVVKRLRTEGLRSISGKESVWVHAVSVGEAISSVPLIRAIRNRHRDLPIVFSVSTLTGHEIARELLGPLVESVFYCPFDFSFSLRRTIRRVRPSLFVLVESDIWPNHVFEMKRHGVPYVLASARLSSRSFKGYRRIGRFMRMMFRDMSSICCQTGTDARRFIDLGASRDRVFVTGNIKYDQLLDLPSQAEVRQLRASMRIDPGAKVFLAGSTHYGEEKILLRTFKGLRKHFPELIMVMAPRDPARVAGLRQLFQEAGLVTFLRTGLLKGANEASPEVIVVDTMGELRWLYATADVVFVGKSLVNRGGQNPLEPAALGKAMLFGPHMFNFELIARTLVREGGAVEVANEVELLARAGELLKDRSRSIAMGKRAHGVFVSNRGAVERTLGIVERVLSP